MSQLRVKNNLVTSRFHEKCVQVKNGGKKVRKFVRMVGLIYYPQAFVVLKIPCVFQRVSSSNV